MVRGLDRFAGHFAAHREKYVLIGGTALVILAERAGLPVRGTKDLDIVLCLEALDPAFVAAFWEFVKLGGYRRQERGDGKRVFYRFQDPTDNSFPAMIELFSRKPDTLTIPEGQTLAPIPGDGELDSLSAILLDDYYYAFLHAQKKTDEESGVSIVDTCGLIALKAYAWLNLSADRAAGKSIDSKKIAKHRTDVFRLFGMVKQNERVDAPGQVRDDVGRFLDALDPEIEIQGVKGAEVQSVLRTVFGIKVD